MAQAGQTHRRQEGTKAKTGSANGASSHQKSGPRQTAPSRPSNIGRQNGRSASARGRTTKRTSSNGRTGGNTRARTGSNGHNGSKASGTGTKRRTTSGAGTKRGTTSARKPQRSSQRKPSRQPSRSPQRSSQGSRSRESKRSISTPDPRWGLVPLTTAGLGGAAWTILRRRRRKRGLARVLDLTAARHVLGRELGEATDLAQTAGRGTGHFLLSRAKGAQGTAQMAGRSTGRFLLSRAKDAQGTARVAGRSTGRILRRQARQAQNTAQSTGRQTGRVLRRGAKEIQSALPKRRRPTGAARLRQQLLAGGQELTSQGQRLASQVPSRTEDAWPLVLALVPGAAYSAARLRASHRLPIQCSVDVAVPIEVVYDEWMALEFLPEGSHCVTEIERTDDGLVGKINGSLRSTAWEAEILDERDCESFAWRSTQGSDCAGLITFHQLGERLTRLELQLDVLPVGGREAFQLSLHTADRRAEAQLRRFKARLETMSPDAYEDGRQTDDTDQDEKED